jgi:flagellar basal body L-ring protein FlgH
MLPKPKILPKLPPMKQAPVTPGLTGNFGSSIPTAAPLAGSATQHYSQFKPVFQPQGGGFGAADQTRGAFARALSDSQNAATAGDVQTFNLENQRKAQQARAQDVQQQRQIGTDRFGLQRQTASMKADIANRKAQGMADIATQLDVAKKNAKAQALDNAFNFTVGALSLFNPAGGAMMGAKAAGSILGGLMR